MFFCYPDSGPMVQELEALTTTNILVNDGRFLRSHGSYLSREYEVVLQRVCDGRMAICFDRRTWIVNHSAFGISKEIWKEINIFQFDRGYSHMYLVGIIGAWFRFSHVISEDICSLSKWSVYYPLPAWLKSQKNCLHH